MLLAHPQSPAVVSTSLQEPCPGVTPDPHTLRYPQQGCPHTGTLLSDPPPSPPKPTHSPTDLTGVAHCDEDRAGQKGHRQRGEANTVTVCQEMA